MSGIIGVPNLMLGSALVKVNKLRPINQLWPIDVSHCPVPEWVSANIKIICKSLDLWWCIVSKEVLISSKPHEDDAS
jgi:hypothetical protein